MYQCSACQYPKYHRVGSCPKCGKTEKPRAVALLEPHPTYVALKTYQFNTLAGRSDSVLRVSNRHPQSKSLEVCRRGFKNGANDQALFNEPTGIALDKKGNVFVTDTLNHCVRKISPTGNVTTFAGSGARGLTDGRAKKAQFNCPTGITIDNKGYLYVVDTHNHCLRKISPRGQVKQIIFDGRPQGSIAVDQSGQLYLHAIISLYGRERSCIVRINSKDQLALLVKHDETYQWIPFTAGDDQRPLTVWSTQRTKPLQPVYFHPQNQNLSLVINHSNEVFASDGQKIFKITPQGISIIAGSEMGYIDGDSKQARFNGIQGMTIDSDDNLYIADSFNHCVRKVTPSGEVTTLTQYHRSEQIPLKRPAGVAVDPKGNVYITDTGNWRICRLLMSEYQELLYHQSLLKSKFQRSILRTILSYQGQFMDTIHQFFNALQPKGEAVDKALPLQQVQFEDVFSKGDRTQQLHTTQQFITRCKSIQQVDLNPAYALFANILNSQEISVRALLLREASYLMKNIEEALMWVNLLANHTEPNRLLRKYKIQILEYIGKTYELYGNVIPLIIDSMKDSEEEIYEYAMNTLLGIRNLGYESLIDPLIEELVQ